MQIRKCTSIPLHHSIITKMDRGRAVLLMNDHGDPEPINPPGTGTAVHEYTILRNNEAPQPLRAL